MGVAMKWATQPLSVGNGDQLLRRFMEYAAVWLDHLGLHRNGYLQLLNACCSSGLMFSSVFYEMRRLLVQVLVYNGLDYEWWTQDMCI
jgi:hypothetical protein